MKIFGYEIAKNSHGEAFTATGEALISEITKAVESFNWARNVLVGQHGCAAPQCDPFLLSTLFDCNGYHSNAIYWKQAATVGQGYECSDALRLKIEQANEDESFQDILDKSSLDLETYGNMYIEPVNDGYSTYFYTSPALLTRVVPPPDKDPEAEEGYRQFVYKKGYGLHSQPFDKFKYGMRTGIRQLKIASPTADPWYGKPEYLSATRILKLNLSIITLAEKWFENSMMLDKLFTLEGGKFTPDQKREMAGFMKRSMKGLQNAAKGLVLELQRGSKLTVQDMTSSMKDAPFGTLRDANIQEASTAHRVPLALLGVTPQGQLGATGLIEGMFKIFKVGFANARQKKLEAFWRNLFRDCKLPDYQTFTLIPMDTKGGEASASDLSQLTTAQILTPQQANEEWMTEKGQFTAKGAAAFVQILKMIDEGRKML